MEVCESTKLKLALKEEINALKKNKTWDLIKILEDRKVVGCKWIYKMNKVVDDKVDKYKARLVA